MNLISIRTQQLKDVVNLVNQNGQTLKEMTESIRTVPSFVGDIANASSEKTTGLEHVGKALGQMDQKTQQNSALVEENAATAKALEAQAAALPEQVSQFRVG